MTIVFNSNTALIIASLITAFFGYLGVMRQTKQVKDQVQSPNGTTTAAAIQLIKADVKEIRAHQHQTARALTEHLLASVQVVDKE